MWEQRVPFLPGRANNHFQGECSNHEANLTEGKYCNHLQLGFLDELNTPVTIQMIPN